MIFFVFIVFEDPARLRPPPPPQTINLVKPLVLEGLWFGGGGGSKSRWVLKNPKKQKNKSL
jgi:hypothetical protein